MVTSSDKMEYLITDAWHQICAKFRCETATDPVQKRFEVGRCNEVIIESSFLNSNIASLGDPIIYQAAVMSRLVNDVDTSPTPLIPQI